MSIHRQFRFSINRHRRCSLLSVIAFTTCAAVLASCSDTDRSAGTFCAELQTQLPALEVPPANSDEVEQLVSRFKKLNRLTPLAIEEQWRILTELVEMASDVIPSDPASRQAISDAAYEAERPTRELTFWVESTCGFLMPDVVGIEGNRMP